jgi:hypothetical protein
MRDEIEDILDNFDFEKVKKVVDVLEWQWFDAELGIPSVPELRKCARRLLIVVGEKVTKSAEISTEATIATGGFCAKAYKYDDTEKIYFKLAFEVSTWDNYE